MESLLTHPAVVIFSVSGLIGFIAWLIRLESKATSNDKSTNDLWVEFNDHKEKADIHFNKGVAEQVAIRQAERMDRMQSDISEIKGMVKEIKSAK